MEYFERDVSLPAIEHVYRQLPLTPEIVSQINPELSLTDLTADMTEIGYPG
jgi:hypothetical protein